MWGDCQIQVAAINMMIDLKQVQDVISCINDVDVILVSRPVCAVRHIFSSCAQTKKVIPFPKINTFIDITLTIQMLWHK